MSESDAVAMVSDRLVGGMMFHSDHADAMRIIGLGWRAHEDGFIDDAKSLRRIRKASVRYLGMVPPNGGQRRLESGVDTSGMTREDVSTSVAKRVLMATLTEWRDWERGTAEVFAEAASALSGHANLWRIVREMQSGAEREHAEAVALIEEMDVCGWDMTHAYDRLGCR